MGKLAPQHLVLSDGIVQAMALNIHTHDWRLPISGNILRSKRHLLLNALEVCGGLAANIQQQSLQCIEDLSRGSTLRKRKDNWIDCLAFSRAID